MDRLARALRLVDAFRAQGELQTSDVMRILEVERPAAMRYLESLREADVPIKPQGRAHARKWVVTDQTWRRGGVALEPGEVFALHFGRQLLGFVDGTSFSAGHDQLRKKLKVGTSGNIANLEEKLAKRFVFLSEPYRRYKQVDAALEAVISALMLGHELEMDYGSRAAERQWKHVRPLALVVYRRALYLLVRLGSERKVLRLAVERIRSAACSTREFAYPRTFDVRKELDRIYGIYDDHRQPDWVRMRFSPQVADLVEQRTWHPSAIVTMEPDGSAVLTLKASGVELSRLALEFGSMVEVLEPQWLRDEVRQQLEMALELYKSD